MSELHRVCVFRSTVRTMDTDSHAVASVPALDHLADFDGIIQFVSPDFRISCSVMQHLPKHRFSRFLQDIPCGSSSVAAGSGESVRHLVDIIPQVNRTFQFQAQSVSVTYITQVAATR